MNVFEQTLIAYRYALQHYELTDSERASVLRGIEQMEQKIREEQDNGEFRN